MSDKTIERVTKLLFDTPYAADLQWVEVERIACEIIDALDLRVETKDWGKAGSQITRRVTPWVASRQGDTTGGRTI